MGDDFFAKGHELRAEGVPFATAVVVRAERPTSGKPGDRAIVTLDGELFGWVGGSCAQPTVVREALRAMADGSPRLVRLSPVPGSGPLPDGIVEVPMTCFSGGTLDIFIEPQQPAPGLLVVGELPVARALIRLGKALDFRVTVVDPGERRHPEADVIVRDLSEIPAHVTPLTFAVVATHGEYDEAALKTILGTSAAYVGLVASRKRGEEVVGSLASEGLDDAARNRVRYPAGLDIKAASGDEIALSILAEIVQVRRTMGEVDWGADEAPTEPETAVDPICHMTVLVPDAKHTHVHEGRTYYFCCGGCRARFAEAPEKYLLAG